MKVKDIAIANLLSLCNNTSISPETRLKVSEILLSLPSEDQFKDVTFPTEKENK